MGEHCVGVLYRGNNVSEKKVKEVSGCEKNPSNQRREKKESFFLV